LLSATPPRPLCRRSELVHRFKVRLGCDVGEGVGRSQSVIVVRDDLGALEIFANQFESKAETAQAICGLAQKWQIGDWMGPPTLRYQGNVDGPFRPSLSYPANRQVVRNPRLWRPGFLVSMSIHPRAALPPGRRSPLLFTPNCQRWSARSRHTRFTTRSPE